MRYPARSALRLGLGAIASGGLALAALPALAQAYYDAPTVGEVTVTGRLGAYGEPSTLSRAVNIADLDLRYDRDVREMQRRVRATARDLCRELDEQGPGDGLAPSCEDAAVRGAQRQTRIAVADARERSYYAYRAPDAYEYAPPASAAEPYDR
jgi:UrcA family protein